ncbi:hypothetical protein STRIP9103_02608 [Streptomyces ipomoeae 91-03]|uniref:Uncharacterized protein n=1 Tax=Streptomyces ipomoeae 91-03 TaxID=698759 RepID=L1KHH5_9ACTN|nr:hypothetical protein STRIP9103_02608 [Streptomyces ipomoeae 91-03]
MPEALGSPGRPTTLHPKPVQLTDDDVLFGDVWKREGVCPRDRSLITIAILAGTSGPTRRSATCAWAWTTSAPRTNSSRPLRPDGQEGPHGTSYGTPTTKALSERFTGDVRADGITAAIPPPRLTATTVRFTPCARTSRAPARSRPHRARHRRRIRRRPFHD